MRTSFFSSLAAAYPENAWGLQGRAIRTFGGLALLLFLALLCLGGYLIEDQFSNPLASHSVGLFTAAFLLAIAMTLLYELMQLPRTVRGIAARRHTPPLLLPALRSAGVTARASRPRYEHRTDLPYQRCYVDRVRVRA